MPDAGEEMTLTSLGPGPEPFTRVFNTNRTALAVKDLGFQTVKDVFAYHVITQRCAVVADTD